MFWCVLGHADAEGRQVVPAALDEEECSSQDEELEEMWFVSPTTSQVFSRHSVMPVAFVQNNASGQRDPFFCSWQPRSGLTNALSGRILAGAGRALGSANKRKRQDGAGGGAGASAGAGVGHNRAGAGASAGVGAGHNGAGAGGGVVPAAVPAAVPPAVPLVVAVVVDDIMALPYPSTVLTMGGRSPPVLNALSDATDCPTTEESLPLCSLPTFNQYLVSLSPDQVCICVAAVFAFFKPNVAERQEYWDVIKARLVARDNGETLRAILREHDLTEANLQRLWATMTEDFCRCLMARPTGHFGCERFLCACVSCSHFHVLFPVHVQSLSITS